MSKKSSIFKEQAAYGVIVVLPDYAESNVGGIEVPTDKASELPVGTVVAIGKVPPQFWFHPLRLGSKVVYAKASANQVKLDVAGKIQVCKCLLWSDLRMSSPPTDESLAVIKGSHGTFTIRSRIRAWLYAVGGTFVAGFFAGVLVGPSIKWASGLKWWLKRKFGKGGVAQNGGD